MATERSEGKSLLETCEEARARLTRWECKFLDNLKLKVFRRQNFNETELTCLEDLWVKVTELDKE